MVPAVTMQIDKIPLNQNQKVNKKALPLPERKVEEIVKPENETQQKLFDCIAEVLGYTEFGITTDIYEAGLTSITAIKLNILISKAFDIVIKTSDIKDHPTIQMLESFVKTAGKETKREIQENYPLTNTQEGIFIECTANMGSTIYNIPYLLKLDKKVDLDKLAEAIDSTVAAHPYLKTRLFMSDEGEVLQKRDDALTYKTQIINGMNRETLVRPYMLFNEQLFRFEIHRTCDGNYLFLDIHHIVADGTSLGIILNDINRAYSGEKLEVEEYTSYDLALDNRDALASDAYKNAENYYKSVFENAGGSINFYPDKSGAAPTAEMYHRETSEFSVQDVKAFCKKHGITENVFFISAFGITLGKYNFSVSQKAKDKIIDYTVKLGLRIGIVGLYNIQFIVAGDDDVYVIEVNPRSSRTVPFLSKSTGVQMAHIATQVILGKSLRELGITEVYGREKQRWYVKAPAFSFAKIRGVDSYLSPEMKSTGEAIGYDDKLTRALYKALQATGMHVSNYGTIFVTIADQDKLQALPLVKRFYDLGFNIEATTGTAEFLREHGIRTRTRRKLSEGSSEIIEALRQGHISYVINTIDINQHNTRLDGYEIRRTAVENNVTVFTALETVRVLLDVLEEITLRVSTIDAK